MTTDDDLFDHVADVVVVGSGAAGYAAALTAAGEGATVVMLERAEHVGGTTRLSGGTAWVPNNSLMREHGLVDPRQDALQFLCRLAFPHRYDPHHETLGLERRDFELIETFYDVGPLAIEHLRHMGAIDVFFDGDTPDYHSFIPENKAPYGRRVPQRGGIEPMYDRLEKTREELGVKLLLEHRAHRLVRNEDDEVFAIEARTGTRTVLIRARKAVVFGSGGFLHNPELVGNFLPGRVFGGCAVPTNTGDFLRIAGEAGAQLGNMGRAWWKQVIVEQELRAPGSLGLFGSGGDSMIQVNRHGVRVVNEKAPYNERGQVHAHWSPTRREYPNLLLFHLWDAAAMEVQDLGVQRRPLPELGESPDYWVVEGSDWTDLAEKIDARLETLAPHSGGVALSDDFVRNLKVTVERFNGFARAGVDDDFHRGANAIEVRWTGAGRGGVKNPTMAPLADSGPYYCAVVGAGALDTNSGPRINTKAQVLDVSGDPIPGLYGAGNCVSTISGQAYWGPGGTIGPAITYGYLAGINSVKESIKKSTL